MVHLGLGSFFLAHQAWSTELAPDGAGWGYAAFGGRGSARSSLLAEQDGCATVVVRGPSVDSHKRIGCVVAAHGADDDHAWASYFADPAVAVVTTTVTEAGYLVAASGGADLDHPALRHDVEVLRTTGADVDPDGGGHPTTVPGRLVAGLAARRRADAGPVTLVPCDNLPANGAVLRRVLVDVASEVDPGLADWIDRSVAVVSTVVDRITPRTTAADHDAFTRETGIDDRCLVVTEPFHEWILSGTFVGGRPGWEEAGARFVDDVELFERRKLWLLNGAHSLLAYAGPLRGHATVAEAMADDVVAGWVDDWWTEASRHLDLPAEETADYRAALVGRFTNPRIAHHLAQIAADGSQKIPARTLPTLRAERTAGRPGIAAARVLAAWLCHLRGRGVPVSDPRAETLTGLVSGPLDRGTRGVLADLAPELADDGELVSTVAHLAEQLGGLSRG